MSRPGGRQRPLRPRKGAAAGQHSTAEPLDVIVSRIGNGGDGIAEHPLGRFYIPLTVPGDRVTVRAVQPCGDGIRAEVVAMHEAGSGRSTPPCPHFGHCGGCALQHLAEDSYVGWKLDRLRTALARAGAPDCPVAPLARTPPGGRRRATFAAIRPRRLPAPVIVGFNGRRASDVVDLAACPVIDPRLLSLLPHLRRVLGGLLAPGQQTDVFATLVDGALDVVIDLPQPPALDGREALAAFAVEADVARLSWRLSSHSDSEPVATRRSVAATLAGVAVLPPPGAFRQASAEGEAALVTAVLDAVGDATPVADLFCGIGTFTVPLMRRGLAVTAVDRDGALVDSLAAACRPWPRVSCRRRDLFKQALTAAELAGFAAVVIDPPRAGAAVQMAELARSSVPVVVAVSCNPETFARDARLLVDGGYRLVHVTPVDQFLWSPHLELAAVFRR